jgi:hypothetical protein
MGSKCCGSIKYISKKEFVLIDEDEGIPKEYKEKCKGTDGQGSQENSQKEYYKNNLKVIVF